MKTYAKIEDDKLVYPSEEEFSGIANWKLNDSILRKHGYMPLVGEHGTKEGYVAKPSSWEICIETETVNEQRQVYYNVLDDKGNRIGREFDMREVPVMKDKSYISVLSWDFVKKPVVVEPKVDDTDFKTACALFRNVCFQIGEFIGDPNFKGGFDDYARFIGSASSKQSKASASLLASMWNGANEYAKYEGSKLGYGQPEWWYKCWEYSGEELITDGDDSESEAE